MTTEEDKVFLNIMNAVNKMDLSDDEKADEMMEQFIDVYMDLPATQHNPQILAMMRQTHPDLFV